MWKLCLAATDRAMSNPSAVRPAAPVPAAPIFRKSRRVTCGTQFLQGTGLQATKLSLPTGPGECQHERPGVTVGLDMNAWFEALGRSFSEAARDRGATVASPE